MTYKISTPLCLHTYKKLEITKKNQKTQINGGVVGGFQKIVETERDKGCGKKERVWGLKLWKQRHQQQQ